MRRRGLIGGLPGAAFGAVGLFSGRSQAAKPLNHGLRLRPEYGDQGFEYVFDETSQRWVGQECQLRVLAERPLPVPLQRPDYAPTLVVQQFGGLTIDNARVLGGIANVQQEPPWVWWWIDKAIGDYELKRPQRLGVQLHWPDEPLADKAGEQRPRSEALELFVLPAIDALPPGQWGPWQRAVSLVDAGNAAWQVANGRQTKAGNVADLRWPFELRCRAALWETPYLRKRH